MACSIGFPELKQIYWVADPGQQTVAECTNKRPEICDKCANNKLQATVQIYKS